MFPESIYKIILKFNEQKYTLYMDIIVCVLQVIAKDNPFVLGIRDTETVQVNIIALPTSFLSLLTLPH